MNKQITVTLNRPLTERERWFILETRVLPNALEYEIADELRSQLRSALKAEQKPRLVTLRLYEGDVTEILESDINEVLEFEIATQLKKWQAEQKPEEPKTITLGPDTPLGWYKVCDKDATGKEQYNYLRDKVELVEHGFIDDKTVAIFRSPVGHFSLRYGIGLIEPVAPPAPDQSEGENVVEDTPEQFIDYIVVQMWDDMKRLAFVDFKRLRELMRESIAEAYSRGRSDLKREYEAKFKEVKV